MIKHNEYQTPKVSYPALVRIDALALAFGYQWLNGAYVKVTNAKSVPTSRKNASTRRHRGKGSALPIAFYDAARALGSGQSIGIRSYKPATTSNSRAKAVLHSWFWKQRTSHGVVYRMSTVGGEIVVTRS